MLARIREALGRKAGQAPPAPPEVSLASQVGGDVDQFLSCLEALNGKGHRASSPAEAGAVVGGIVAGRSTVAARSPFLEACGIAGEIEDEAAWRKACATADVGITSASYALADTGTLVMLASATEPRLASLLPPIHIAVIPASSILSGLNELFSKVPEPAKVASSMVLITGPSRTADIEQILVRGVHGPGEIHVVVVTG